MIDSLTTSCSARLKALGALSFLCLSGAIQADSKVEIYGTMHYAWDFADTNDATGDAADDATGTDHASLIGFSASEDLGDGMSAFFAIDSDIAGTIGSNQAFVGIEGDFGRVAMGQMDTPYKSATADWNLWGDTTGDYTAIMGADAAGNTHFDSTAAQAIAYTSPEMNGLRLAIMRLSVKDNDAAGAKDDSAWSVALSYGNDLLAPLSLVVAYETHDGDSVGFGSTDTAGEDAWRLGGQYEMGDTILAAVYEDIEHDDNTLRASRSAYWLSAAHSVGNNTFGVTYAKADDSDTAGGDDGASQVTLGVQHALSERTGIYALYSTVSNDTNAQYGLQGGGFGAAAAGRDVDAFSFGIVHNF